ncbi:MAG: ComEC/Rec2 family competence protein [Lactobacillaceae bacterium]
MAGYWFFPTILFMGVFYLIFGGPKLLICLIIFWIIRIYFLRKPQIWFWSLIFFLLAIIWGSYCRQVDQKILLPKTNWVVINPNNVQVKGDLAQMKGQANNIPVLVTAKINSAKQKNKLIKNTHWFKLKVTSKFERIESPHNESEFNYRDYAHRQLHCDYAAFLSDFKPQIITESLIQKIFRIKREIYVYLLSFPYYSQLFLQLLLGGPVPLATKESLNHLGLLTLFSLGGMQLFLWLGFWEHLAARLRIVKSLVNFFSICTLLILIIFNFEKVGLTRSAIFLVIREIRKLTGWQLAPLDLWSGTFLFFILINPQFLFGLGGCLSFLITFFIQTKVLENRFITNLKINLVICPLVLKQMFVWQTLGLITSWLFFPIVASLFPLLGINLLFHLPLIDQLVNQIFKFLFILIDGLSNLNFGEIIFGKLTIPEVIILIICGVIGLTKKGFKHPGLILAVAFGSLVYIGNHYPITGRVIMFDIGQGDSLLIETPLHRQIILIDTGGKLAFKQANWQKAERRSKAETVVLNYLHSRGIDHLDAVITTHQDADHIGDLPRLISKIKIKKLVYGQGILENPSYWKKVAPLIKKSQFIEVKGGDILDINGLKLNIFNPMTSGKGENTDSITFLTQLGGLKFLFTGDLDQAGERRILSRYSLQADILKVGHHGSKTSTSIDFLKTVKPKLAWISAGRNNRYNHPSSETLMRLRQQKIPWLITKDQGMVYYQYSLLKKEIKWFQKNGFK